MTDRERFERLFAEHHRAVQRFARRRLASAADADDVVAETFTVAWRRLDEAPIEVLPWLYAVAHRILANQRRGDRRRSELARRLAAEPRPARDTPGEEPLIAALLSLPDDERDALLLVAWEGLDRRSAALVAGCSVSAMAARLHRARRRLRRTLDAGRRVATPVAASQETR